jgi:hypothetical protein
MSLAKKARFLAIFGKLEITFTRTKVISLLPHRKWEESRRYALLGCDKTSVAIVEFGKWELKCPRNRQEGLRLLAEMRSAPEIKHLHFDKNHMCISIGNGRCREFFRKIGGRK